MNRRKILQVLFTIAVLGGVGAWSYSSGSSEPSSAASFSSDPGLNPGALDPGSLAPSPTAKRPAATTSTVPPSTVPPSTVPAPTTTVAANPQAYAAALFGYWERRDHANAAKVASAAVVKRLFLARPWLASDGWSSQGCTGTAASLTCTWGSHDRHFAFQVQGATGGLPLQVVSLRITHP